MVIEQDAVDPRKAAVEAAIAGLKPVRLRSRRQKRYQKQKHHRSTRVKPP